MPPEISPWERNELSRDRKNERAWNGNVGARWRDKERDRDVRVSRDRHWGSNEFRRPNGYGKQGWHMYTEDFARGPGPSRPNKRFFDDGTCLKIDKYGRDSSRDIRGGSFSQRDWRGHCWDAAPAPRSNGCANMRARVSVKSSAADMLAYNSYPRSNIGKNWDPLHFRDQHYNNSVASGQHTRRRVGRKDSVGLNTRKPLKWTRSGSLYSRHGTSHSSSPKSLGLDSGEIKVPSHFQNPSPVHSLSGNIATCATSPSEETNSSGCGIRHSSSPKSLHLNCGEIKVPSLPQTQSLVHSLLGSPVACATSAHAEETETNSSGCGYSNSSSPKILGLDSCEIKVPLHSQNPSSGNSFSGKDASCAAYASAEETNSPKKPRLGWGEGLAQFEKIINRSTDTAENDGSIESPHSDSKNCTEAEHSHNSTVALKTVQCFTKCPSPVKPSVAFCSSPGEEKLSVKAVDADTSNLGSSPCPESQNQRDGLAFNLENLEVTGLANFSSSLREFLQFDNLCSLKSDCMRFREMNKLLVLKADIAKKVEITESEIDLLENELKTLISDTGNASPYSTGKPSEELCATSNLIARLVSLGPNYSGDMMKMSPGGLVGELAESRDVDIDSLGTETSQVAEPLLAGTLFSEKTHKYGESSWNADRGWDEDRERKAIVYSVKEENSGAIFSNQFTSRDFMFSVDVKLHREHMAYDLLTASNKDFAHRAAKVFSKLLPTNLLAVDHSSFDISPCWKKKAIVREKLARRKRLLRLKERVLILKYRALKHLWKEDTLHLFTSKSCLMSQKNFKLSSPVVYRSNPKQRPFIRARFSSHAGSPSLVPSAEVINFASKLLKNSHIKLYSSALKMPSLILDNKEKIASRFISNNGLVEDPSTAEKERCMFNSWTSKEKEIFMDGLTTFGKDFRKIASFLDHKTTADCIEFYYKNHKSDCFQRTRKKKEFPKNGKSCSTSTFLVTSGKRRASISNAASLDMLGAASVIVAHVDDKLSDQKKCPRKVFGTCNPRTWGDDGICKKSITPDVLGNERESIAVDVLADIYGSLSSEVMSSCITSSMDLGEKYQERKNQQLGSSVRQPLTPEDIHNVSETCSDESCGEVDPTNWTDDEKSNFIQAVTSYGKDFTMISQYVRTRSSDQCKVFFSKARKCLRLDTVLDSNQRIPASDDAKGGGGSDNENACVVETICNEKSGSRVAEDQLSSNFKENLYGSRPVRTTKMQPDFDCLEKHNWSKKLDVEDIEHSSDNLVSSNHAEKAELDLDAGSSIENCRHRVIPTVQNIENGIWGADRYFLKNDTIVREDNDHGMPTVLAAECDIKAEGEVCGVTSRINNAGHGVLMPCHSLSGKDVGFADVNSSSFSGISCANQGRRTTSSDGSSFLAVGKNPLAKGVHGGENKIPKLLNPLRKSPAVSSKQYSSCKSQDPVVQGRKRLAYDTASHFDSGKFSNKQFQKPVRRDKYHKHSCENSSLDLVDPLQISRGCPVSITAKNGINGCISRTKPVSARSILNSVEHFSAQHCHLKKCTSSKQHLDASSELHSLSQYHSKDHPGVPELQCSSDSNMPRDSDVGVFDRSSSCPPNCRLQDNHLNGILASSKFDRNNKSGC